MWPKVYHSSIYYGAPKSPEYHPRAAYAEFLEDRHKLYGDWTTIADGDMITLNEFIHLYHLKESKEFGYYERVPWDRKSRLDIDLPSSFRYWKSRYFFVLGDGWETLSDDF